MSLVEVVGASSTAGTHRTGDVCQLHSLIELKIKASKGKLLGVLTDNFKRSHTFVAWRAFQVVQSVRS